MIMSTLLLFIAILSLAIGSLIYFKRYLADSVDARWSKILLGMGGIYCCEMLGIVVSKYLMPAISVAWRSLDVLLCSICIPVVFSIFALALASQPPGKRSHLATVIHRFLEGKR